MQILSYLAGIVYLICFIMVLIKMFQTEGVVKGILAFLCGLYAFIWGWMNSAQHNLRNIMLIWTVAILVLIVTSFMGAPIYTP